MRRINRCLNKQLQSLCQQSVQIDELNCKISHFLPDSLREKCHVGSFNKGCLLIATNNPASATQLRYLIPELRDNLRIQGGLYQLISIKVMITADEYSPAKAKSNQSKKPCLSAMARNAISNAAELCTYPALKETLFNLANSQEKEI